MRINLSRSILLYLIKGYQHILSPFFAPTCRFYPTCSQYGYLAILRYGVVRGLWFLVKRILRCHPFTPGGYDPLPKEEGKDLGESGDNNLFRLLGFGVSFLILRLFTSN